MKKITYLLMASLLTVGLQSCLKEENKNNVKNTLNDGNWFVFYFAEDNAVETSGYNGFGIDFNSDGSLVVSGNDTSFTGTWNVTGNEDHTKVNLHFGPNDPWEELNEDWDVIELTDARITLKHTSGGNGGIDDLILQRAI